MTSYIQRLLQGATPTPGITTARAPMFVSQSPVFESDQRLGIFPDNLMEMESTIDAQSTRVNSDYLGEASSDNNLVGETTNNNSLLTTPTTDHGVPLLPIASSAPLIQNIFAEAIVHSPSEKDVEITPKQESVSKRGAVDTPRDVKSPWERLAESDPLSSDFDFNDPFKILRESDVTIPGLSEVGQAGHTERFDHSSEKAQPSQQSKYSILQDFTQETQNSSIKQRVSSLTTESDLTPVLNRDPRISIPDILSVDLIKEDLNQEDVSASSTPAADLSSSPLATPTQQAVESVPVQTPIDSVPAPTIETRIEEKIIEKAPEITLPKTAAEASVIGPLPRPSIASRLMSLRRF